MKVGDLVKAATNEENSTGVILNIRKDVEFPHLVEVLWDNGYISRVYEGLLEIINNNSKD